MGQRRKTDQDENILRNDDDDDTKHTHSRIYMQTKRFVQSKQIEITIGSYFSNDVMWNSAKPFSN